MNQNRNYALLKALSGLPSYLESIQNLLQSVVDDKDSSSNVSLNCKLAIGNIDFVIRPLLCIMKFASDNTAFNENEDTSSSPDGPKSND